MHPLAIVGATAVKLAHYAVCGAVGALIIKKLPDAQPAARKALVSGLASGIVASRWLSSAAEEARLKAGDMLAEARTSLGEEVPPPSAVKVDHDHHGHEH
ncbi:hypothetical protein DEJ50_08090 [Streptomyces venezuelae]|uniref:DUF1490 domain-containing protein n=1 Tax=Streptomyces venezuelae TaxID=54571 RepID=A0A5P2CY01_STRVZ|nr:DUF1490 family protein [Streptomyces venezuelae]QES47776.1 hypothetical protein DEJ50_08090 [Streptomyces venezuelae]